MIEGLTSLSSAESSRPLVGSRFSLPPSFDTRKFASKWVADGPAVEEAKQDQIIASANVKAVGWAVFQGVNLEAAKGDDAESAKKAPKLAPVTRVVGAKRFVLMFRPIALQQAINRLYANESRDRLNGELLGDTAQVNETGDPGILTNHDLQKMQRSYDGDDMPVALPRVRGESNPSRAAELAIQ